MRVIVETNILLSALINPHGLPVQVIDAWRGGRFRTHHIARSIARTFEIYRHKAKCAVGIADGIVRGG